MFVCGERERERPWGMLTVKDAASRLPRCARRTGSETEKAVAEFICMQAVAKKRIPNTRRMRTV